MSLATCQLKRWNLQKKRYCSIHGVQMIDSHILAINRCASALIRCCVSCCSLQCGHGLQNVSDDEGEGSKAPDDHHVAEDAVVCRLAVQRGPVLL